MVRPRVRIRFSKQSALRLIGHRDLMRSLERTFRRAGLPPCMSEGYRPKPRMHFPLALAVGMEGRREVMEIQLHAAASAEELLARLRAQAPAGLGFESLDVLPPGDRGAAPAAARAVSASYQIAVSGARERAPGEPGLEENIRRLLCASTWPVRRSNRPAPVDARAGLLALALRGDIVEMRLAAGPGDSRMDIPVRSRLAGPRDVLAALRLDGLERQGSVLIRTEVEIAT